METVERINVNDTYALVLDEHALQGGGRAILCLMPEAFHPFVVWTEYNERGRFYGEYFHNIHAAMSDYLSR